MASTAEIETFKLPSGQSIAYTLSYASEPQRPTVLLANPLGSSLEFWADIVPHLHSAGFRVLRFDPPGHGHSGNVPNPTSTTFASMAASVHALLTSPPIVSAFTGHHAPSTTPGSLLPSLHAWIGVSMGAALGVVFATTYPGAVRSLVACDTISCSPGNAGGADTFGPRIEAAQRDGNMVRTSGETLQRWFGDEWLQAHGDKTARLRALMETTQVEGFEACCSALRSETFDLRLLTGKLVGSVEHVRYVVGEKDANLPETMCELQEGTLAGFKAAGKADEKVDLSIIPAAGHVSFIDGEEEWLKAVLPFLKQ